MPAGTCLRETTSDGRSSHGVLQRSDVSCVPRISDDGHTLLWLCIHLSAGPACLEDRACASGACVQGHCVAQPVPDGKLCDSDDDCLNRTCAKQACAENAPLMCCLHGDAIRFNVPWNKAHEICSHAPPKTTCSDDRSCESGVCALGLCASDYLEDGARCDTDTDCRNLHCGRQEYAKESPFVCCPEGHALMFADNPWDFLGDDWICSHAPAGSKCFDDLSCDSGVCLLGVCANNTLPDGAICDSHRDCANAMCGRGTNQRSAPYVCCPFGEAAYQFVPWKTDGYDTICSMPGYIQFEQ